MKKTYYLIGLMLMLFAFATNAISQSQKQHSDGYPCFVRVQANRFFVGDKEYRYIGTNFWPAAILGSEGQGGNRSRLTKELDRMKKLGITNLRVLVGGDGFGLGADQIQPTLQTAPGVYNDTILRGLDYLMVQLEKRHMTAVLYLNNAWQWSGGFGQYLEWSDAGPIAPANDWDAYQTYHSQFTKNAKARDMAARHTRFIVSRTNTITGKPYSESPALMAWEIANEPRAFARDSVTKHCFAQWIHEQAAIIKSIDHNHLVTTGSEGYYGCECDIQLFEQIHADPNIDYATIHIWPFTWGWIGTFASPSTEAVKKNKLTAVVDGVDSACKHTLEYINWHADAMKAMGKPLVIEEFGYPRDNFSILQGTPTTGRDAYYKYVLGMLHTNDMIAGINFWGWGGKVRIVNPFWTLGQPYTGDPAQEEQGLYSVFSSDKSTLKVIREVVKGGY